MLLLLFTFLIWSFKWRVRSESSSVRHLFPRRVQYLMAQQDFPITIEEGTTCKHCRVTNPAFILLLVLVSFLWSSHSKILVGSLLIELSFPFILKFEIYFTYFIFLLTFFLRSILIFLPLLIYSKNSLFRLTLFRWTFPFTLKTINLFVL